MESRKAALVIMGRVGGSPRLPDRRGEHGRQGRLPLRRTLHL
jgi:hypothetical protein